MTTWKKDETEFTVSVNYNDERGYQSTIPKPIMEILGNPDKITFVKKRTQITLRAGGV